MCLVLQRGDLHGQTLCKAGGRAGGPTGREHAQGCEGSEQAVQRVEQGGKRRKLLKIKRIETFSRSVCERRGASAPAAGAGPWGCAGHWLWFGGGGVVFRLLLRPKTAAVQ